MFQSQLPPSSKSNLKPSTVADCPGSMLLRRASNLDETLVVLSLGPLEHSDVLFLEIASDYGTKSWAGLCTQTRHAWDLRPIRCWDR